MHQQVQQRRLKPIRFVLLALALVALLAAAATRAAQPTKVVAKKLDNAGLGKTILATRGGRTLYSLSAEKKGRWICTGACTSTWRPLVVPTGTKPKGPVRLGTIKRPDGRMQVTYKGLPLYTFGGDSKAGQANGEGIKDVGTWHAAGVAALPAQPPATEPTPPAVTQPPPQPQPEPPYPSPYPYPYP
jgi:predicted lipoprotein with Yx(FWY)xxD motif